MEEDKNSGTVIFPGCDGLYFPSSPPDSIWLKVKGWDKADELLSLHFEYLSKLASSLGKREVCIFYEEGKPPLRVLAVGQINLITNPIIQFTKGKNMIPNIDIPELNFDFYALYRSKNPVYITEMSTQKVLFANPSALMSQGKTPSEFIGESAYLLNDPDELEQRDKFLVEPEGTGELTNYEYGGWRWHRDEESGLWRLKRMNFVSSFRVVNFLNAQCRLGEVLSAEETGHVVVV